MQLNEDNEYDLLLQRLLVFLFSVYDLKNKWDPWKILLPTFITKLYTMTYLVGFQQKHRNCVLEYICCSSFSHSVASASSRPARSPNRGHPLRLPLLLHLRLHPHRHLPSPRRLPRCWGDQAHPGQGAHGLCSHCASGDETAVLSHNCSQKMLRLLPPS